MNNEEINTFDEIATMIKKANDYDVLVNKCKQLEKALDILKKKLKINTYYLSLIDYEEGLTIKEYKLLKEVLDCE